MAVFILLSVIRRNSAILLEEDAKNMQNGVHIPTFDVAAHGKLRVKSEMGEFYCS